MSDDAGFQERDRTSLQHIYDSEKRQSPHETGMYRMSSRSYFHIPEVLQVLSGSRLAALDPDDVLKSENSRMAGLAGSPGMAGSSHTAFL